MVNYLLFGIHEAYRHLENILKTILLVRRRHICVRTILARVKCNNCWSMLNGTQSHNGPFCFELVDHLDVCEYAFVSNKNESKRHDTKAIVFCHFSCVGWSTAKINSVHALHCDKSHKMDATKSIFGRMEIRRIPIECAEFAAPEFVLFFSFHLGKVIGMEIGNSQSSPFSKWSLIIDFLLTRSREVIRAAKKIYSFIERMTSHHITRSIVR